MTFVTSDDGARLAVRSWGSDGAPPLVMVHGLGMSVQSWGLLPDRLRADYRVLAYDLRGHGDSSAAPGGDYSLEAHARDLRAVLRTAVRAGRPAVLVGNSLGGGIILEASRCWEEGQVAGVVFAGSGGSAVTAPGLPAGSLPAPLQHAVQRLWLWTLRSLIWTSQHLRGLTPVADAVTRRLAFSDGSPHELVAHVRQDFLRTRRRALVRTTFASLDHEAAALAPGLSVPALVLHGDRDPEVPSQEARDLAAALPDAELVTLHGSAHMLPLSDPERVAHEIRRWTTTVPSSPRAGEPPTVEETT